MTTDTPWSPRRIPQTQPHQEHLSHGIDQWLGDSPRAARAAGRKGGATDTNLQPLLDGAGAIHAHTPKESGYVFLALGGGRRRPLTDAELHRPFDQWSRRDFILLRRTRRFGIRYASRVRPLLYGESVEMHKKYGATPCFELKARFGKERATGMVDFAHRARQTVWFKTLVFQSLHPPTPPYSMRAAGEKLADFHGAGGQTALATHGYPPPSDLDEWRHVIDSFWGSSAERYRP